MVLPAHGSSGSRTSLSGRTSGRISRGGAADSTRFTQSTASSRSKARDRKPKRGTAGSAVGSVHSSPPRSGSPRVWNKMTYAIDDPEDVSPPRPRPPQPHIGSIPPTALSPARRPTLPASPPLPASPRLPSSPIAVLRGVEPPAPPPTAPLPLVSPPSPRGRSLSRTSESLEGDLVLVSAPPPPPPVDHRRAMLSASPPPPGAIEAIRRMHNHPPSPPPEVHILRAEVEESRKQVDALTGALEEAQRTRDQEQLATDTLISDIQRQHHADLEGVQRQHECDLDDLRRRHEERLRRHDGETAALIETLRGEYEEETRRMLDDLKQQHREEARRREEELTATLHDAIRRQEEANGTVIQSLTLKHQAELDRVKLEAQTQIDELESQLRATLQGWHDADARWSEEQRLLEMSLNDISAPLPLSSPSGTAPLHILEGAEQGARRLLETLEHDMWVSSVLGMASRPAPVHIPPPPEPVPIPVPSPCPVDQARLLAMTENLALARRELAGVDDARARAEHNAIEARAARDALQRELSKERLRHAEEVQARESQIERLKRELTETSSALQCSKAQDTARFRVEMQQKDLRIADLQREVDGVRAQNASYQQRIEAAEHKMQKLQDEANAEHGKVVRLTGQLESATASLQQARDRSEQSSVELQYAHKELDLLRREVEQLRVGDVERQHRLTEVEHVALEKTAREKSLAVSLAELEAKLSAMSNERSAAEIRSAEMEALLKSAQSRAAIAEAKVDEERDLRDRVEASLQAMHEEMEAVKVGAQQRVAEARAETAEYAATVERLHDEIERGKAPVAQLKMALEETQESLQSLKTRFESDVTKLHNELASRDADVAMLSSMVELKNGTVASLEKDLNTITSQLVDTHRIQHKLATKEEELAKHRQHIAITEADLLCLQQELKAKDSELRALKLQFSEAPPRTSHVSWVEQELRTLQHQLSTTQPLTTEDLRGHAAFLQDLIRYWKGPSTATPSTSPGKQISPRLTHSTTHYAVQSPLPIRHISRGTLRSSSPMSPMPSVNNSTATMSPVMESPEFV